MDLHSVKRKHTSLYGCTHSVLQVSSGLGGGLGGGGLGGGLTSTVGGGLNKPGTLGQCLQQCTGHT